MDEARIGKMKDRMVDTYRSVVVHGLTGRAEDLSPRTTGGFVRAGITRTLAGFLARYPGVSAQRLLADASIGAAQLADPDALLSLPLCVTLLEQAARDSGDQAFGLGFAAQLPWQDFGVLGYLVMHSPTAGAALGNACRYFAVQQTSGGSVLELDGDDAVLAYDVDDARLGNHGQNSELVLGVFARLIREGTGRTCWTPREVHFKHRAPKHRGVQERFFRAAVLYDQPRDQLVMSADDLRTPMRSADAGLFPILSRHADDSLARIPVVDDFASDMRRLVISRLGSGEITVEQIAQQLGMSTRSIQRQLHAHGLSFTALVADVRLAMSKQYLEDPSRSLTDAAFLLGYSDLSAFSRAFRRWTGQSAIEYRRAHCPISQARTRIVPG